MAIIKNFRATTFNRAFFLNALATTITVVVALFVRESLERSEVKPGQKTPDPPLSAGLVVATIAATFVSALVAYYSLHWIFGFGGGMLASDVEVHFSEQEQKDLANHFRKGKGNLTISMQHKVVSKPVPNSKKPIIQPFPQSLSL